MAQAFPRLDGLVRLSHSEGVDIRRPLLRVLTDLYVQEQAHTREEEQQYVELALRLLPAVDVATRAAVAAKLSAYALTPAPVVEALLQDVPEVAALMRAAVLPALAAAREPAEPAPAEPPPAPVAADNEELGERFLRLESAARVLLLDRDDEGERSAAELLGLPARPGTAGRLERAALSANQHEFSRELRHALGLSGRIAARIVQDDTGEPLLVAAAALDIGRDVLLRILLFLHPKIGHSVERVFALYRLYPRLSQEAVAAIVTSWRSEAAARASGRLQPLLAPDQARAGARAAAHPREPAAAPRREASDPRLRGQGST